MGNELQIQIVQNLVPVVSAKIELGGGAKVVFGDTMTGTGTPTDPVNVSGDILSQISNNTQSSQNNASQIQNLQNTIEDVSNQLATVQDVIPTTASSQNQLADQGFVNSSIQTATAYFRGDWATWADVPSDPSQYPADATGNHTPITNDYMVVIADEQENGGTWRYKYTGSWAEQGKSGWMPEYQVNETPLTAAQLAALNSGVTAQVVASIADKQDKGDYATKDDLTSYVKNTDYATKQKGGIITIYPDYGTDISTSGGLLRGVVRTVEQHIASSILSFISKGTLENIKDDYVKRGITENTIELTDEEKAAAKSWLGFADGADINEVTAVIPATANPDNQLADQGFVNSSIQTSTAHFRGNWDTWADVPSDPELYPVDANDNRAPTPNDYLVVVADEQHDGGTWRYKYTGLWSEQGKDGWQAEYQVNETPLTAAQLAALNSGATPEMLTSFVKKTDYATSTKAGVVAVSSTYGTGMAERFLCASIHSLSSYKNTLVANGIIAKGTLENVLTQYSKAPTVTEQNENSVELADNTIYNAGETASLTITFPTVDLKYTSQLNFTSGATATAFTAPADIKWAGDSIVDGAFVPETNKRYVILFYYDGVNICAIAKGE